MNLSFQVRTHTRTQRGWTNRDLREHRKTPRAYFWPKGESILDNLVNRRSRPYNEYRRALPEVSEALGLPRDTKWKWDQYAGCRMCPCSPGFVAQEVHGVYKDAHVDVVDLDNPPPPTPEETQGSAMEALIATL